MHWLMLAQFVAPTPVVMDSPLPTIVKVAYGAVAAVTVAVGLALTAFLLERAKNSKTFRVLAIANDSAQKLAAKEGASLMPDVYAALADGRIDPDEWKALKAKALTTFKAHMGDTGLSTLKSVAGALVPAGIESYVEGFVEQAFLTVFPVVTVAPAPKSADTEAAMASGLAKASGYVAEKAADGSVTAVKVTINPSMPPAGK